MHEGRLVIITLLLLAGAGACTYGLYGGPTSSEPHWEAVIVSPTRTICSITFHEGDTFEVWERSGEVFVDGFREVWDLRCDGDAERWECARTYDYNLELNAFEAEGGGVVDLEGRKYGDEIELDIYVARHCTGADCDALGERLGVDPGCDGSMGMSASIVQVEGDGDTGGGDTSGPMDSSVSVDTAIDTDTAAHTDTDVSTDTDTTVRDTDTATDTDAT